MSLLCKEICHSHQYPPHPHVPHSRIHTGSWGFYVTKALPWRQQILWDLLTIVHLTTEQNLNLLYPPSVWESSISPNCNSSSFITPTPFTSSTTSFRFNRYNKHTLPRVRGYTERRYIRSLQLLSREGVILIWRIMLSCKSVKNKTIVFLLLVHWLWTS